MREEKMLSSGFYVAFENPDTICYTACVEPGAGVADLRHIRSST